MKLFHTTLAELPNDSSMSYLWVTKTASVPESKVGNEAGNPVERIA